MTDYTPTELFDTLHIYGDIASNHQGNRKTYDALVHGIVEAGGIPKIQLYSPKTFDRDWDLPSVFVPSVFKPDDLDYVLKHKPLALKIASVESTYYELVSLCGQTGLPLIISTGGMDDEELLALCEVIDPFTPNVCLMHCVSMYPTPRKHANMSRIALLGDTMDDMLLQPHVGWSSHHTYDVLIELLPIALAYDALQIEVHVKLNETDHGTPDLDSSISPTQMATIRLAVHKLADVFGDSYGEYYVPPDRAAVLEWRSRWCARSEGEVDV